MPALRAQPVPQPCLKVSLKDTLADQRSFTFTQSFRIGRTDECEVCIRSEYVSRIHAEVIFERQLVGSRSPEQQRPFRGWGKN